MTSEQLKLGRKNAGLPQAQAAKRLGLSQPYLSQLERGRRPVTAEVARAAVRLFGLPPTALPTPRERPRKVLDANHFARLLAALGHPGYSHVRRAEPLNPAAVVLDALSQDNLDARVAAALPWVLLRYPHLSWEWLWTHAKLRNLQNRLGFLVALAGALARRQPGWAGAVPSLEAAERELERARLAAETTLCREAMPAAERRWLRENRSKPAEHWNVLTSLTAGHVPHAS